MNADQQARRDFELNQQARMREAHEFRTWQEQQAYNNRIAFERQREEDRRAAEARRQSKGW